MTSMRINGCLLMICKMLNRLLLNIGTPCLGSQGLGGGVVLSIERLSVVICHLALIFMLSYISCFIVFYYIIVHLYIVHYLYSPLVWFVVSL